MQVNTTGYVALNFCVKGLQLSTELFTGEIALQLNLYTPNTIAAITPRSSF